MVQFHTTLSERSVYLRYFCSLSLSTRVEHERLVRICFGSYDRGFALVADRKNPETGQHEVLGVGRFSAINRTEAEAAVLVSDQWQGRGLRNRIAGRRGSGGSRGTVPTIVGRNSARQFSHSSHLQKDRIQAARDGRPVVGLGPCWNFSQSCVAASGDRMPK